METTGTVAAAHRVMELQAVKLGDWAFQAARLDGFGNSRAGFGYLNDGSLDVHDMSPMQRF